MSSLTIAGISFGCIFGGVLLGKLLRRVLPAHHVQDDSKDIIKLGAGFVATMAALVLGLLVSSAKSSFDAMNEGFKQGGVKVLILDRTLKQFGPETMPLREQLRRQTGVLIELIWPTHGRPKDNVAAVENGQELEAMQVMIRLLPVTNERQKALQTQALGLCNDLMHSRWLMIEHTQNALPPVFFVVVIFWLTMLHVSFGLLSPPNLTVLVVLLVSSLSITAALFLINEMNNPMEGVLRVSQGPLQKVLEHLGK